jgi:hypothetical protein
VEVRELSPDDAAWAADLMEQRRRDYVRFSPVFWRPAENVTALHARFLRSQITSDASVSLRTDHGFIIAQRRTAEGTVDDFAMDRDGTWNEDGAVLLLAASERLAAAGALTQVRVVTAHADEPKASMLASLSAGSGTVVGAGAGTRCAAGKPRRGQGDRIFRIPRSCSSGLRSWRSGTAG